MSTRPPGGPGYQEPDGPSRPPRRSSLLGKPVVVVSAVTAVVVAAALVAAVQVFGGGNGSPGGQAVANAGSAGEFRARSLVRCRLPLARRFQGDIAPWNHRA